MSVLTTQKAYDQTFDEIILKEFAPQVSPTAPQAAPAQKRSFLKYTLVLVAFAVAGICGAIFGSDNSGTPASTQTQPAYTVTTKVIPAQPGAPVVHGKSVIPTGHKVAPVAITSQPVQADTKSTPALGPVPKTSVAGKTATATETRPASGTQNQAQPVPVTKAVPDAAPATKPEPATKPQTQPKPATDNGAGTTTPVVTAPVVPAAPPAPPATTVTAPAPKPQPAAPTTTVVNSSSDGAGTTGNAITDQGTGDTSLGSQMPKGTGPAQYNPGANAGPSF